MSRRVVFGTGQVGRHLLDQLVSAGHDAIGVNRSGRSPVAGATPVAGDATDPEFTTRVARGADVVYFCLNAARYARWAEGPTRARTSRTTIPFDQPAVGCRDFSAPTSVCEN